MTATSRITEVPASSPKLVRPPADGPDIQVPARDGRPTVWIEATTVDLGSKGDHAGRIETQKVGDHGALFYPQPDKTALRDTHALHTKDKQRQDFIERGIVAPDDIFIVAINGGLLHDYSSGDADPEILKSVYPIGDAYVRYAVSHPNPPPVEHGNFYRDHVTKAAGTEIKTDGFLSGVYGGISALVYSRTTGWNPQPRCRDHMLTIHNKTARIPLPRGLLSFGREAVPGENEICWTKHSAVVVPMGPGHEPSDAA